MPARTVLALSAALAAGASAALAQEDEPWAPVGLLGTHARDTIAKPSPEDLMAVWPAKAARKRQPGNALARCTADWSGTISNCRIVVERPARAGFGEALLSLAPRFRLSKATQDTRPPAADVLLSASWTIPDTPPDWRVAPKPNDFSTTYTPAAWRSGKPGVVIMNCSVARLGDLRDCMVVYQRPPGLGFGEMALRFASYIKLKPATLDGKAITSGVNIPFHFPAGGGDAP